MKHMNKEARQDFYHLIAPQILKLNDEFVRYIMSVAVDWDDFDPTDVAMVLTSAYRDLVWGVEEEFEPKEEE